MTAIEGEMMDVREYRERLERAERMLSDAAEGAKRKSDYDEQRRLEAKRQGVMLALDYLRAHA